MSEALQIHQLVSLFLKERRVKKVWFASGTNPPPLGAYHVNFSRLCIITSGQIEFEISTKDGIEKIKASSGEAVFIPSQCWDNPFWSQDVQTLTYMFAPGQVGLSLNRSKGSTVIPEAKSSIIGGLKSEGKLIEQALNEMAFYNPDSPAAPALTEAVIQYCQQHLNKETNEVSRTYRRWESICLYLQKNYGKDITREKIASEFAITPNHLSRLFRQEGKMGFNDYLSYVRIAQAKLLLSRYQLNLDEIADRIGFKGGDYLGRVFRKNTGLTPGEFRAKYAKNEAN